MNIFFTAVNNPDEVKKMKKHLFFVLTSGLILAIIITNALTFVENGLALDKLRNNVLRLHVLANSDSDYDQEMKLKVRDALLESGILSGAADLDEAEEIAEHKLRDIEVLAELTLEEYGCNQTVHASLTDMDFDDRQYGDMTMPKGRYKALRVVIGEGKGHNWWCVMYPPLCLPAAENVKNDKAAEVSFFNEKEQDILEKPQKYKVRFAIWDTICSFADNDEKKTAKYIVRPDDILAAAKGERDGQRKQDSTGR